MDWFQQWKTGQILLHILVAIINSKGLITAPSGEQQYRMCKKNELISGGQNIFISKPGHFTLQSFTHVHLFIHSYDHTCISRGHYNSEDMGWMDRFY